QTEESVPSQEAAAQPALADTEQPAAPKQQDPAPVAEQPQVQEEEAQAMQGNDDAALRTDSEESRFMEHFIHLTREMGLQYYEKDLYNFHTAMKSNTLNIIAGMSGTGKSR